MSLYLAFWLVAAPQSPLRLGLISYNYSKSQAPEKSNPSQGADLTGSGRGIVDAILISKAPNSAILFDVAF